MTTTTANKNMEQRLRRALNKHGYSLHKSRRSFGYPNLGGYLIVLDKFNACVAGQNFELDHDDVEDFVSQWCVE